MGLQISTLLAGLVLCGMGILKIGNAIKFIPYPVIVGFTSGIAVVIFIGQWKEFFGLPVSIPVEASFFQKLLLLVPSFGQLNLQTTLFSLVSLSVLVVGARYMKKFPVPLLVLVFATFAQQHLHFANINTIGSVFGGIPQQFPKFVWPDFYQINITKLLAPAFTIALLGAIESLLSASAADTMMGTKHKANQELIGQGLANFLAPFWGGFASTGAMARTVTNIRNGGNCIIAAIVHAIVLVSILLIFAPYAKHIPLSSLSAILFLVAFNMSDLPGFLNIIKKAPWYDVVVLLITFFLTVFTDLVLAVTVGFIVATLFLLMRLHQSVNVDKQQVEFIHKPHKLSRKFLSEGIIYVIEGPLFFGVIEKIEHALGVTQTDPKFVVFRLLHVPFIDMSGLEIFSKIVQQYHKRGVRVYLCEANKKVVQKLLKSGVLDWTENKSVFDSLNDVAHYYKRFTKVDTLFCTP